eukprot:CAMPEP_0184659222 /NCGR_PEP_ID=MMETSP0308-20130426/28896_1 /TAXON_ID=38269 /ORGANISM="Gloeochaete witrockiana, Strain SAG 46.84" /LENGTH=134 /DNA_ID=CAMNT_0027098899 /DNA_START=36 /DNA_END=440 /DNA_ORIENTATION=+
MAHFLRRSFLGASQLKMRSPADFSSFWKPAAVNVPGRIETLSENDLDQYHGMKNVLLRLTALKEAGANVDAELKTLFTDATSAPWFPVAESKLVQEPLWINLANKFGDKGKELPEAENTKAERQRLVKAINEAF